MIDTLAETIAVSLKKMNESETTSVDIMKFSLIAILNTGSITVLTLAIGFFSGKFTDTLIALAAFAVLRMCSGGYHLHSSDICVLTSTLFFSIIPHIPVNPYLVLALSLIAFILVLIFAPSEIENKTRISKQYYPLLKIISACLVTVNFILLSPILAIVFFTQAVSLVVKGGESQ